LAPAASFLPASVVPSKILPTCFYHSIPKFASITCFISQSSAQTGQAEAPGLASRDCAAGAPIDMKPEARFARRTLCFLSAT
jgi:hypothetical protein